MKNERLLEILQEFFLDKGLVLEGRMEKAICASIECALKGYRIEGKKEDIKEFKKGLPRFASHHNVTIIEN